MTRLDISEAPSVFLVGAPRFELGTPSPPDWCANRAALRSVTFATIETGHFARNIRSPSAMSRRKVPAESVVAPLAQIDRETSLQRYPKLATRTDRRLQERTGAARGSAPRRGGRADWLADRSERRLVCRNDRHLARRPRGRIPQHCNREASRSRHAGTTQRDQADQRFWLRRGVQRIVPRRVGLADGARRALRFTLIGPVGARRIAQFIRAAIYANAL